MHPWVFIDFIPKIVVALLVPNFKLFKDYKVYILLLVN